MPPSGGASGPTIPSLLKVSRPIPYPPASKSDPPSVRSEGGDVAIPILPC